VPDPRDDRPPRNRLEAVVAPANGEERRYPAALESAMALIEEQAGQPKGCDLAAIAAAVYTSPAYLSRLFRRETGLTFSRYCNGVRLRKAVRLMVDQPFLSITRVALACGFRSLRTFEEQFGRVFGMAPREYREEVRAWLRRDGRGGG
jgi:transcriptional regulator GlxA family with amidase domain